MIKKHISIFSFISLLSITSIAQAEIKYVMIDPSFLLHTSESKASAYIGKLAAAAYVIFKGKIPNKEAFYTALKKLKGQTTLQTFNDGLKMPSLLCDWLLSLKPNAALKSEILSKINESPMDKREKAVFSDIIEMMLTPAKLVDTFYIETEALAILKSLSAQNVKIILAGNWDEESLAVLRSQFSEIFSLVDFVAISGTIKQLKPSTDFYSNIFTQFTIQPEECISIEVEQKFVEEAKKTGMHVIISKKVDKYNIKSQLAQLGIQITV